MQMSKNVNNDDWMGTIGKIKWIELVSGLKIIGFLHHAWYVIAECNNIR